VRWDNPRGKWGANIRVDGKTEHLGSFEPTPAGEVSAALAYDEVAWGIGRGPKSANFEPVDAPSDKGSHLKLDLALCIQSPNKTISCLAPLRAATGWTQNPLVIG
jgi:hypothetical protein